MFKELYKKNSFCWIVSLLIVFISLFIILNLVKNQSIDAELLKQQEKEIMNIVVEDQTPAFTSNEDFYGEQTHFSFSPDKQYIVFVQDVFEEYGYDWDKYWALKLFDPVKKLEKTLFVDDVKMSSYEWLNNETIRVYHNTGTGVRSFRDISIDILEPIFYKDYKYLEDNSFWQIDEEYVKNVRELQEARGEYFRLK